MSTSKKYPRNWNEYNDKLVKRGEMILDLEFLGNWNGEIEKMKNGKVGGQYQYPPTFIMFLAVIHFLFNLPLRQTEGFINKLKIFVPGLKKPDFNNRKKGKHG